MTALDPLYRFLSDTTYDSLDPAVVAHTRWVVADTLGVIIAASTEPETTRLAAALCEINPAGTATAWRQGFPMLPAPQAAFLNGATGPFLELDEGHRYFSTHGAIHVLPACLALAEHLGSAGRDLLTALILGYDTAARIGGACRKNPKLHPHGTWATVGAAVACARLRGFDADHMRRVIHLAAGLTLATSSRTTFEGATVRNATAGCAAQTGLLCALMAESGFTGLEDSLQETFGNISAIEFSVNRLLDGLGERFEITRNFFKLHACCQFNHVTLDALDDLLGRHPVEAGEIEQVDVYTFERAAHMRNSHPPNMLAAKFSLPYAIGARLVTGHTGVEAFRAKGDEAVAIHEVAGRVQLHADPVLSERYPYQRSAHVVVRLRGGLQYETFRQAAHGYDEPVSDTTLTHKFIELTTPVIGRSAHRLLAQIQQIDSLESITVVSEELRRMT